MNELSSLVVFRPEIAPLIMAICRLLKVREAVNQVVNWDDAKAQVSPGLLVEALVINILTDRRPLWKIQQFYAQQDLSLLFGDEVTLDQLNDDAFGRCLEKLALVNLTHLVAQVALKALSIHRLDISSVFLDTTSISVQGEFAGEQFKDFDLVFGNSKDKRPDLKQLMVGLAVQQDGLPFFGEPLKGNASDKHWNPETVERLSELTGDGYRDILFVADSALVNTEDINRFCDPEDFILFVSRFLGKLRPGQ